MDQVADYSLPMHKEFPGVSPRPEAQEEEAQPTREKWVRRFKMAGAIGMVALLEMTSLGGQVYAGDPSIGPRVAVEYALQQEANEVSSQTIEKVKQDLAQPSHIHEFLNSSEDSSEQAEFEYVRQQAKAHGFELADYPSLLEQAKQTKNINELMILINEYTNENFGFSIMFPQHLGVPEIGMGVETLDADTINDPENFEGIRGGLLAIMECYSYIPSEIIKESGLKEILLIKHLSPVYADQSASGEANPLTDRIYLDPSIFSVAEDADGAVHELGHILDAHFNKLRGMSHDPGFIRNNRRGLSYGADGGYKFGFDVADPYSKENQMEDKADIYSEILMAIPQYVYATGSSPQKAKAIYLLAELEQHYPGFTAYMNAITDRVSE